MGASIEHSICMFIPSRMKVYEEDFLKQMIEAAGVDCSFFDSDLVQANAPLPVEGFRQIIGLCLSLGYSEEAVCKMVSTNAAPVNAA
jgi:hypothetical protein